MLRTVRKGSRKKCRRKKEGGREKRRKRWRKSSLLGDVRLDQCLVSSFSWPFCSHPRCLAQRSDDHTDSLGSSETQLCGKKFYCNHWTPFPGSLGKSLQWCLRKKCSWLGPFDSLSCCFFFFFSVAFSLLSPRHNFWGLYIRLRKCWSIVLIFFLTGLQLAARAYTNTTN